MSEEKKPMMTAKEKIAELQGKLKSMSAKCASADVEMKKLKDSLGQKDMTVDELNRKFSNKNRELMTLKKQLEGVQKSEKTSAQKVETLEMEIERIRHDLAVAKTESGQAAKKCTQMEAQKKSDEQKVADLEFENEELRRKLQKVAQDDAEKRCEILEEEKRELTERLQSGEVDMETLTRTIEKLNLDVKQGEEKWEAEKQALVAELEELRDNLEGLAEEDDNEGIDRTPGPAFE